MPKKRKTVKRGRRATPVAGPATSKRGRAPLKKPMNLVKRSRGMVMIARCPSGHEERKFHPHKKGVV